MINPGPHDPAETALVISANAAVIPKTVSPSLYAELESEFDGFKDCSLVSRHTFTEPWPTWEMHPKGDEIICLLDGDIDFVLWVDRSEQAVRVTEPGTCVVVPRGTWHTARPHVPTTMLFITPGEGTEIAPAPPPD